MKITQVQYRYPTNSVVKNTFFRDRSFSSLNLKSGFTLIELMIVIAIVAILATVAVPTYQNYTKKAAMSELIQASAPYKSEVELCIYHTNDKTKCSAGSNGIQGESAEKGKYIKSIKVANGVITVAGNNSLSDVSYTLTASGSASEGVSWTANCGSNSELFPAGFCN